MAVQLVVDDHTDFNIVNGNLQILQTKTLFESEAQPTGIGTSPWIAIWCQIKPTGSSAYDLATGRAKLEFVAEYTNNTTTTIEMSDVPLDNAGSIPAAGGWYVVRGDGRFRVSTEPTTSTTVAQAVGAGDRERLPLSTSLRLNRLIGYWLDN